VKLHRRPAEQIAGRPRPWAIFERVARDNLQRLTTALDLLTERKAMKAGWYQGEINLVLGDARQLEWSGALASTLVTSPPYGDNTTTVPYGQHAFLPLQWIDLRDIDSRADAECLRSTSYEIDRRSLGGSKRITASDVETLSRKSSSLRPVLEQLSLHERSDRLKRVVAFMRDLDEAIGRVLPALEASGTAAWTVGSRRVGGKLIPLEQVIVDLAKPHGCAHVNTLRRDIPGHRKRMASRNGSGATMSREHVVVLRRCA